MARRSSKPSFPMKSKDCTCAQCHKITTRSQTVCIEREFARGARSLRVCKGGCK